MPEERPPRCQRAPGRYRPLSERQLFLLTGFVLVMVIRGSLPIRGSPVPFSSAFIRRSGREP